MEWFILTLIIVGAIDFYLTPTDSNSNLNDNLASSDSLQEKFENIQGGLKKPSMDSGGLNQNSLNQIPSSLRDQLVELEEIRNAVQDSSSSFLGGSEMIGLIFAVCALIGLYWRYNHNQNASNANSTETLITESQMDQILNPHSIENQSVYLIDSQSTIPPQPSNYWNQFYNTVLSYFREWYAFIFALALYFYILDYAARWYWWNFMTRRTLALDVRHERTRLTRQLEILERERGVLRKNFNRHISTNIQPDGVNEIFDLIDANALARASVSLKLEELDELERSYIRYIPPFRPVPLSLFDRAHSLPISRGNRAFHTQTFWFLRCLRFISRFSRR